MSRPHNFKDEAQRVLAQVQGYPTYKSVSPCKEGHIERFVSNKHCVECTKGYQASHAWRTSRLTMRYERQANGEEMRGYMT